MERNYVVQEQFAMMKVQELRQALQAENQVRAGREPRTPWSIPHRNRIILAAATLMLGLLSLSSYGFR